MPATCSISPECTLDSALRDVRDPAVRAPVRLSVPRWPIGSPGSEPQLGTDPRAMSARQGLEVADFGGEWRPLPGRGVARRVKRGDSIPTTAAPC